MVDVKIELAGEERVDEVRTLWLELHRHERRVAPSIPFAELYSLSVAQEWRSQGVGTLLLDFVDAELEARAIRDLRVAVTVGNADAQRLYERRGLQPTEIILYRFAGVAPLARGPRRGLNS